MIEKANAIKKYTKQHSSFTYGFKIFAPTVATLFARSLSLKFFAGRNGKFDFNWDGDGLRRGVFFQHLSLLTMYTFKYLMSVLWKKYI